MPAFVYFDGQVTRTLTAQASNGADQTNYSFASQSLGTETASRFIVVAIVGGGAAAGRSVSSCSVGGVAANALVNANATNVAEMWVTPRVVDGGPTGTSGTVAVNFSGSMFNAIIAVYAIDGASSTTPSSTVSDTSAPLSSTLTIPAGGVGIAVAHASVTPGNTTWGGLTEDSDQGIEPRVGSTASLESISGASPTVTVSWSAGVAEGFAAASWGP